MKLYRLTEIDRDRLTLFLFNGGGQPPFNKFHRLVRFLSNYKLNLVALELPGHGNSPFVEYMTAEQMLSEFYVELEGYFDQFGQVALLGYSLGALLGLKAIEKTTLRFEFIIALGAGIVISKPEEQMMQYYTTKEFFESRHWLPSMLEYHKHAWKLLLESIHDMLHVGSAIFMDPDSLAGDTPPIYLILGEDDEVANYDLHQDLARKKEFINLHVVPQTSHFDYFVGAWRKTKAIIGKILKQKGL